MSRDIRVVVIGGGRNNEHEVSRASAAGIRSAFDPDRYDVRGLTILADGRWADGDGHALVGGASAAIAEIASADVVFPAVHGAHGEDGALAGLCELVGVPYVGSGVRAGALGMDKWVTKLVAADHDIRIARGIVAVRGERFELPSWLRLPVVVKPTASGSSHGVSLVDRAEHLPAALDAAFAHDDRVLVEEAIEGREVDIAVLERADGSIVVSPPLEIVTETGSLFDTERKYGAAPPFLLPAALTSDELASLEEAATALYRAIGCRGVARVDFFLTPDGPVLNEINTMPGFTAHSQVPLMFAAMGISYSSLLDLLVEAALSRPHSERELHSQGMESLTRSAGFPRL